MLPGFALLVGREAGNDVLTRERITRQYYVQVEGGKGTLGLCTHTSYIRKTAGDMRTALMSMCRREYCLASYTAYPDEERSGGLSPPSQGSLMPHD